ncbi:MAG: hypothetical protein ACI7YS_14040 [Flavobacterium sp.]
MILRKNPANLNEQEYLNNLPNNNDNIAQYVLNNNGQLPLVPPIEIHPYLNDFPLNNCEKYIIGTFPPISYIYDHPLLVGNNIGQNNIPNIPFYHGNLASMWKYLLDENEYDEVNHILNNANGREDAKQFLIEFLENNNINYSDIYYSTVRNNYNANDNGLKNIKPNYSLIYHILNNDNAKYLNFNSSTIFNTEELGFYLNNIQGNLPGEIKEKSNSFSVFLKTLQKLGFGLSLSYQNDEWIPLQFGNIEQINYHFRFKVVFKLRISGKNIKINDEILENLNREFIIVCGPSPSNGANMALVGNQIYLNWLQNQPNEIHLNNPTIYFRKEIYGHFRNDNWQELQNMNVIF